MLDMSGKLSIMNHNHFDIAINLACKPWLAVKQNKKLLIDLCCLCLKLTVFESSSGWQRYCAAEY